MDKLMKLLMVLIVAVILVGVTLCSVSAFSPACDEVFNEFKLVMNVGYEPVFDFNNDGMVSVSDMGYLASRMDDEAWCQSILNELNPPVTMSCGGGGMDSTSLSYWLVGHGGLFDEYDKYEEYQEKKYVKLDMYWELYDRLDLLSVYVYYGLEGEEACKIAGIIKSVRLGVPASMCDFVCYGDKGVCLK